MGCGCGSKPAGGAFPIVGDVRTQAVQRIESGIATAPPVALAVAGPHPDEKYWWALVALVALLLVARTQRKR